MVSFPLRTSAREGRMTVTIGRRELLAALGGGAASWPLVARAQQPAMPVIGLLQLGSPEALANRVGAFRKGLSESGYIEGQNVAIEFRWAHNDVDRLPELAADLVRRQVTLIATPFSMPAALAAKNATTTIPIVFSAAGDPVQTRPRRKPQPARWQRHRHYRFRRGACRKAARAPA